MSGVTPERRVSPPGQAVADYLDALLDSGADTADSGTAVRKADWRERSSDFDAQLVIVGGLRLAVPVVEITAVLPASDQSAAGAGGPVLDTAALVLPPAQRQRAAARAAPAYLLCLGEAGALRCHGVGETVRLTPSEITWRNSAGERPWLAGTVMAHRAALLDPLALIAMAEEGSSSTGPGR